MGLQRLWRANCDRCIRMAAGSYGNKRFLKWHLTSKGWMFSRKSNAAGKRVDIVACPRCVKKQDGWPQWIRKEG